MGYNYPLRSDWTTSEIITVTTFYGLIERAYEEGVDRQEVMNAYRAFKTIVPSMAEEKTLFKEFEEVSRYRSYQVIKAAKEGQDGEKIKGTQR